MLANCLWCVDLVIITIFNSRLFKRKKRLKYILSVLFILFISYLIIGTDLFSYFKYPLFVFATLLLMSVFEEKISIVNSVKIIEGPFIFIIIDLIVFIFYTIIFENGILSISAYQNFHTILFNLLVNVISAFFWYLIEEENEYRRIIKKSTTFIITYFILNCILIYCLYFSFQSEQVGTTLFSVFTILVILLSFLTLVIILILFQRQEIIDDLKSTMMSTEYIMYNIKKLADIYYQIQAIEHDVNYQLLKIKQDILEHHEQDAIERIDKNVFKIRKHKNVFISGNPYFDQVFNKIVQKYQEENLLLSIQSDLYQKNFLMENNEIQKIIDLLESILPLIYKEIEIKLFYKFYCIEMQLIFKSKQNFNTEEFKHQLIEINQEMNLKMNDDEIEIHVLFDLIDD